MIVVTHSFQERARDHEKHTEELIAVRSSSEAQVKKLENDLMTTKARHEVSIELIER